jgi:16S rRNA (cytosine967-C5)-methyltransferase
VARNAVLQPTVGDAATVALELRPLPTVLGLAGDVDEHRRGRDLVGVAIGDGRRSDGPLEQRGVGSLRLGEDRIEEHLDERPVRSARLLPRRLPLADRRPLPGLIPFDLVEHRLGSLVAQHGMRLVGETASEHEDDRRASPHRNRESSTHARGRRSARVALVPSARAIAVRVLRDVERGEAFSNRVLGRQLERYADLDPRDRGFATALVYGVLRHRRRLDAHIDAHASNAGKLKGELRQVLRVGAYELRELERPAAIAVSEARRSVSALEGGKRLVGVVQAILGAIDRTGAELDAQLDAGPPLDALDRRWSIPRWLAGRWLAQLGEERARLRAKRLAEVPPLDLRIDLSRIDSDTAATRLREDLPSARIETVAGAPQALRVWGGGDVFHGPLHDEGLVSVQGLAAQQPAIMLAPQPDQRVLDACAGMGIKTLQLAEIMQRRGTVFATDLDPRQLAEIEGLRARGRIRAPFSIETVAADLSAPHPVLDAQPFDAVLVDAPCTGLGNLARHPEIRDRRRYEDIFARAELQRAILRRCLTRCAPGAPLVYAVCSLEPEEGAHVVAEIAAEQQVEIVAERTFTPEDDATEGFYAARLVR